MRKIILLAVVAWVVTSATTVNSTGPSIQGTWKMVSSQYGKNPVETLKENQVSLKTFTRTRWSSAGFDKQTNKISSNCGGTYTLKDNQYKETVEYYSWGDEAIGKTFTFTLEMENGKLHQKGFMEWKGDKQYLIDEWYIRVD
jgi:hypothetical protein